MEITGHAQVLPGGVNNDVGKPPERAAHAGNQLQVDSSNLGPRAERLTLDTNPTAAAAARIVSEAYAALEAQVQYPTAPEELTLGYLTGVEPSALSTREVEALETEYAANLRLTELLDHFMTLFNARKSKLLVQGATLHGLIGKKSGHKSFEDLRGQQSGKGFRAAAQELGIAKTLAANEGARKAVEDGTINMHHVAVISRANWRASRNGSKELSPQEQSTLVEMGKGVTADQYDKNVDRFMHGRDSLAHDASHAEIRRRRFLNVSYSSQGTHIKGFIDPVAGVALRAALAAATPTPSVDDDRDLGQRNADALDAIVHAAMNSGKLKAGALVRPHLSFVLTEKTFHGASQELTRRREAARQTAKQLEKEQGPGVPEPAGGEVAAEASESGVAFEPAEFDDGTPIPLAELTRLLCDAQMSRVVIDANNLPLNLGQTERLYTDHQRRAIILRDKTCRFASCGAPAKFGEVHHIQWWKRDGGETSIENGVLVCRFHHGLIHSGVLEVIHDEHGHPHIVSLQDSSEREPTDQNPTSANRTSTSHADRGRASPYGTAPSPQGPRDPCAKNAWESSDRNQPDPPNAPAPATPGSASDRWSISGQDNPTANYADVEKSSPSLWELTTPKHFGGSPRKRSTRKSPAK